MFFIAINSFLATFWGFTMFVMLNGYPDSPFNPTPINWALCIIGYALSMSVVLLEVRKE